MEMKDSNSRYLKKWMGFIAAIWVQSIAGNNYTFSNYSADLKAVMRLNQTQLNTLSVAKDVGKSFGVFAGLLADILPPWAIFAIGSLIGVFGYGTQWLVISERITPLPLWQMAIAMCLGGNSTTWMNCAVLVTCMRNFKGSRGTVTGILKGFIGLSTAIFTVLCSTLFTGDSSAFLLLLAFLPAAICIIAMIFLHPVPAANGSKEEQEDQDNFMFINIMASLLAVYLLCFATAGEFLAITPAANKLFALGLVIFLLTPLGIPIKLMLPDTLRRSLSSGKKNKMISEVSQPLLKDTDNESCNNNESTTSSTVAILDESTADLSAGKSAHGASKSNNVQQSLVKVNEEGCRSLPRRRPQIGEEFTVWQAMQTFDFWLLFITFLCGIGTGITAMNNLGQMGEAQGYEDVAIFVSLTSIWGFFGRIASGAISEHFVRKSALPRPLWMGVSKLLMIIGYVLLGATTPGSMYISSIVVGVCYGVHITIAVPTASEMFGLGNFGLLYSVLVLNIPLGSFLFSGLLAGFLYDREAAKGIPVSGNVVSTFSNLLTNWLHEDPVQKCTGAHCFKLVCTIMALTCAFGFALDIWLTLRLRPMYQSMFWKRAALMRNRLEGT